MVVAACSGNMQAVHQVAQAVATVAPAWGQTIGRARAEEEAAGAARMAGALRALYNNSGTTQQVGGRGLRWLWASGHRAWSLLYSYGGSYGVVRGLGVCTPLSD